VALLSTKRTAAVGVTRIKLRIHCRRAKPTGERKLRMPMTKCASASGEHAKDAGAILSPGIFQMALICEEKSSCPKLTDA
jgi:hypothetical protein